MLGYTRREMVVADMQSITHPDDWGEARPHTAGHRRRLVSHGAALHPQGPEHDVGPRLGVGDGRRRGSQPGASPTSKTSPSNATAPSGWSGRLRTTS
jgi:hypothetical protein